MALTILPNLHHALRLYQDSQLLAQRKSVYEAAKVLNPQRWTGATRNWSRQDEVWLNPEREKLAA